MDILDDQTWQMSLGERAALEGILTQLKPRLAIEIGTAQGGSLARIAAHSAEVHSFDVVAPNHPAARMSSVTLHHGDSHELLPTKLAEFASLGLNVDFALVDGDHSADGVRKDIEDLLDSSAISSTAILIHDTANETVRAGLDEVQFVAWPKVASVDLDFVAGSLFCEDGLRNELWGGLGMIVVDSAHRGPGSNSVLQQRYYPTAALLAEARDRIVISENGNAGSHRTHAKVGKLDEHITELEGEILRVTAEAAYHEQLWRSMKASVSWRITAPLRALAARARQ